MLQSVVGVWVSSYDALDSGCLDGLNVVVAQSHEQRLFAEPSHFMTAVFLSSAQDSEVRSDVIENLRCRPPDGLHPVVVGGDAVDEVQRVGGIGAVQYLDVAGWLELLVLDPVGLLLLHLSVGVAAAFKG